MGSMDEKRGRGAWRNDPPTLDEIRSGATWWWYRQRGEDGYTAPNCMQIDVDDDGLFFVEPGSPYNITWSATL